MKYKTKPMEEIIAREVEMLHGITKTELKNNRYIDSNLKLLKSRMSDRDFQAYSKFALRISATRIQNHDSQIRSYRHDGHMFYWTYKAIDLMDDQIIGFYFDNNMHPQPVYKKSIYGEMIQKWTKEGLG